MIMVSRCVSRHVKRTRRMAAVIPAWDPSVSAGASSAAENTTLRYIRFPGSTRGRSGHPVLDAGDFDLRGGLFKALGQMTYHISGSRGTHDRLHSSTLCAVKSLEQLGMALIEHGSRSDGSMWEREYGNPKTAGPIRLICILNFDASYAVRHENKQQDFTTRVLENVNAGF
ncbi:hypothetical protein SCUP234_11787 [Seiridium cupressi]